MEREISGDVIDRNHLAAQTLHDEALKMEILAMFIAQMSGAGDALRALAADERGKLAHKFKGTAEAVGAFRLATAASDIMDYPLDDAVLTRFTGAVDDACAEAGRILCEGRKSSDG